MRALLFSLVLAPGLAAAESRMLLWQDPPRFPEENLRAQWDRGCADWKSFLSEADNVGILFERSEERYWLKGHARLRPERGEDQKKLLRSAREELSNSSTFLDWVMPGINEHPRKGSSYFVELNSLKVEVRRPTHVFMTGPFTFAIPGLRLGGTTTIELKWEDTGVPTCPSLSKDEPKLRVWRFKMYPRPDVLEWMIGEMAVVPDETNGRDAIIKIRLTMKPANLVYRLLPTRLIENEMRFRAQRVLANFAELRRAKVWRSGEVSPAGTPAAKAEPPKSKALGSRPAPAAKVSPDKSR
jgi:hypothetical protein